MQPPQPPPERAPAPSFPVVPLVLVLQILLLTIGIHRDYQLKHEDNNALHATFARSHLRLGFDTTRGQNYFYNPASGAGGFYLNHPPGPGLALAVVYGVTGHDGPFMTRAAAIAFHLLGTWLFYGLLRRLSMQRREVVLALLLYVVVPESAFFGRMMNHEVVVLPAAILLVRGYWESIHGDWPWPRWAAAIVGGSVWAAIGGWPGFFASGACALHAAWEAFFRRNSRATSPFIVLAVTGFVLFAATIAQLVWLLDGNVSHLQNLVASRMGVGEKLDLGNRLGRLLELHWRYFGLTSAVGLAAIGFRQARRRTAGPIDPAQEVALIFLLAGAGYVGVFSFNASKHDYWQFLLLPASAIGIVLLLRSLLAATAGPGRRAVRRVLLGVVILDITLATTVTLVQRHVKREGLCIGVVAELRRNHL
jgi:hypothetical protein